MDEDYDYVYEQVLEIVKKGRFNPGRVRTRLNWIILLIIAGMVLEAIFHILSI